MFALTDATKHTPPARIALIDIARGLALVAMTIYHFAWDLEFFGWILPGTIGETGWVLFARGIASTFLYLVGVSLVLGHGNGIRWRSFSKRMVQVVAAAALISLASYLQVTWPAVQEFFEAIGSGNISLVSLINPFAWPASGPGLIFFGILHAIALFSLLALVFVRMPWPVAAVLAVAVFWIGQTVTSASFNAPTWWWVGLAATPPVSNDYVPFFPWFSAVLGGIAFAKIATRLNLWKPVASVTLPSILRTPLTFIGRHSLVYYLLHQPIMLLGLWLFTTFAMQPDRTPSFVHLCVKQCAPANGEQFCRPYCGCVADGLKREQLFDPFHRGEVDLSSNEKAMGVINSCNAAQK